MKLLSTIESIEIARKYQRKDGSWGNVYNIVFKSGDDTIAAETFWTEEGQKRRGIVVGAVGFARLSMATRPWTDRNGINHIAQDINLEDFQLANTNIKIDAAPTTEESSEAANQSANDADSKLPVIEDII